MNEKRLKQIATSLYDEMRCPECNGRGVIHEAEGKYACLECEETGKISLFQVYEDNYDELASVCEELVRLILEA